MSDVNIPLLRKAVEWAEAEATKPPELCKWEQSVYILPTIEDAAAVFPAWSKNCALDYVADARLQFGKSDECGTCYCIAGYVATLTNDDVTYYNAEARASEALGLTPEQSEDLFDQDNSIEQVRSIAEEIAGQRL